MNKRVIFVMASALLMLGGCAREGMNFYRGTYGYALSGTMTCENIDSATIRVFDLSSEQGVMHIEPSGDGAVMTMKNFFGGVYVFDADISGKNISIRPATRRTSVSGKDITVSVSGSGYKTNDLIVCDLKYSGEDFYLVVTPEGEYITERSDTLNYRIKDSSVKLVASKEQ